MASGLGFGVGYQGTPREYIGVYENEQQRQFAMRQAQIKRDEDAYQKVLEDTTIDPESIDWKLQPKAQQVVADFTYQVQKLRREKPNNWQNYVPQLRQDAQWQLANLKSSSAQIKAYRAAVKNGEVYAPESVQRFLNTNQGDFSQLPSDDDMKLGGVTIDPEGLSISISPVKKFNIGESNLHNVYTQKDAYTDVVDPKTGQPQVFKYASGGFEEVRTRRAPGQQFIGSKYEEMWQNPQYQQNLLIQYRDYLKNQPGYSQEMVLDEKKNLRPEFIQGAKQFGYQLLNEGAKPYYVEQAISRVPQTKITVNNNTAGDQVSGVSDIQDSELKLPESYNFFGDTRYTFLPGEAIAKGAHFTYPAKEVTFTNPPKMFDAKTGENVSAAGVTQVKFGDDQRVLVYDNGKLIPANSPEHPDKNGGKIPKNSSWKVMSFGTYKSKVRQGGEMVEVDNDVYVDNDVVRSGIAASLPKQAAFEYRQNNAKLQKQAEELNKKGRGESTPPSGKPTTKSNSSKKSIPGF